MLTDDVEQIKYLEQMRRLDCQATFASLLKMLESPFLSGDRVCVRMTRRHYRIGVIFRRVKILQISQK